MTTIKTIGLATADGRPCINADAESKLDRSITLSFIIVRIYSLIGITLPSILILIPNIAFTIGLVIKNEITILTTTKAICTAERFTPLMSPTKKPIDKNKTISAILAP